MNSTKKLEVATSIADFFYAKYAETEHSGQLSDFILVFGRQDRQLADLATKLYIETWTKLIVVTGGIGKDSEILADIGLTEAGYLSAIMMQSGVDKTHIYPEYMATNGGENCRNSLAIIERQHLPCNTVLVVGHWASLYRLAELFRFEAGKVGLSPALHLTPTKRPKLLNEQEADELIAEFRRLMDWPAKGWLHPINLPAELVEMVNNL